MINKHVVAIGTVAVWDILTTSWLLRGSHDHCDAGMLSLHTMSSLL